MTTPRNGSVVAAVGAATPTVEDVFTVIPTLVAVLILVNCFIDVVKDLVSYIAPMPLPALISLIVAKHMEGLFALQDGRLAVVSVVLAVPKDGALPDVYMHRF